MLNFLRRAFLPLHKTVGNRDFASTSCLAKYSKCLLENRSLIRVCGPESSDFLQGLITNDMHHLDTHEAIYAMFLNIQGRIMFDTLITRDGGEETFLLDCDLNLSDQLLKHLKSYRLRRKKIEIEKMSHMKMWQLFQEDDEEDDSSLNLDQLRGQCDMFFKDPRVEQLGYRVSATGGTLDKIPEGNFKLFRYTLGVSEGNHDIPINKCFPLEYNADYLHGVSFQKGCYIGQELTARTHHTGVIRKRVMPLKIENDKEATDESAVINEKKKNVGKIRGTYEKRGIALVRIEEAMASNQLLVKDTGAIITVDKPDWWPHTAPKTPQNR